MDGDRAGAVVVERRDVPANEVAVVQLALLDQNADARRDNGLGVRGHAKHRVFREGDALLLVLPAHRFVQDHLPVAGDQENDVAHLVLPDGRLVHVDRRRQDGLIHTGRGRRADGENYVLR